MAILNMGMSGVFRRAFPNGTAVVSHTSGTHSRVKLWLWGTAIPLALICLDGAVGTLYHRNGWTNPERSHNPVPGLVRGVSRFSCSADPDPRTEGSAIGMTKKNHPIGGFLQGNP